MVGSASLTTPELSELLPDRAARRRRTNDQLSRRVMVRFAAVRPDRDAAMDHLAALAGSSPNGINRPGSRWRMRFADPLPSWPVAPCLWLWRSWRAGRRLPVRRLAFPAL
jgi:hypothetical protein